MAIVWANTGGVNWTNTTTWYTWDEDSQQGVPYNKVPQKDDIVYLNGKGINANFNVTVAGNSQLRNDAYAPYGINAGGNISISGSNNEMYVYTFGSFYNYGSSYLFYKGGVATAGMTFIGDVYNYSPQAFLFDNNDGTYSNAVKVIGDTHIEDGYFTNRVVSHEISFTGNVYLKNTLLYHSNNRCSGYLTINGNIYVDSTLDNSNIITNRWTLTNLINGSIYNYGNNILFPDTTNSAGISINGNIESQSSRDILLFSKITTLNLNGDIDTIKKLASTITTLNNNGTINTSAPLATNITTLNLNGTINTSNDTIADFPITTTNIQEGSHITCTQQQPLGWGELNAPADFEFEYAGSGVSTGAYIIVNKNEFQHSYPPENYVVSGTTYGDSSQFTGTMVQPDESVVLKDYVYASGTKTGTLDTSSLDVPSDLTQQFNNITNKLGALQTRLSIADIIEALNQYTAVKVSDLASISIDTQDIEDALEDYGVATSSDLANVSTLTTTDLSNSLTTYGAAKPSDVTSALNSYGASKLTQSQVESSVQSKLNSYGAAKPSDVTSALNSYGAAKPSDVSNALSNYGVANYNTVSNAISNANLATAEDIEMIAENMATDEFIAAMINGMFVY